MLEYRQSSLELPNKSIGKFHKIYRFLFRVAKNSLCRIFQWFCSFFQDIFLTAKGSRYCRPEKLINIIVTVFFCEFECKLGSS